MVLERPELDRLHVREPEQQQHCVFEPLVHDDVVTDHFGDPALAAVEQLDRIVHRGARVAVGHHRREVVAPFPECGDGCFEVGQRVLL